MCKGDVQKLDWGLFYRTCLPSSLGLHQACSSSVYLYTVYCIISGPGHRTGVCSTGFAYQVSLACSSSVYFYTVYCIISGSRYRTGVCSTGLPSQVSLGLPKLAPVQCISILYTVSFQGLDTGLGSVLQDSLAKFPLDFPSLLQFSVSLATAGEDSARMVWYS